MDSPRRGQCTSCLDVHGFDKHLWQKRCHREECEGNVILCRTPPEKKMYVALECTELQFAICDETEVYVDCSSCGAPHVILPERVSKNGAEVNLSQKVKEFILQMKEQHKKQQEDLKKAEGLRQQSQEVQTESEEQKTNEDVLRAAMVKAEEEKKAVEVVNAELGEELQKLQERVKVLERAVEDPQLEWNRMMDSVEVLESEKKSLAKKLEFSQRYRKADIEKLRKQLDEVKEHKEKLMDELETSRKSLVEVQEGKDGLMEELEITKKALADVQGPLEDKKKTMRSVMLETDKPGPTLLEMSLDAELRNKNNKISMLEEDVLRLQENLRQQTLETDKPGPTLREMSLDAELRNKNKTISMLEEEVLRLQEDLRQQTNVRNKNKKISMLEDDVLRLKENLQQTNRSSLQVCERQKDELKETKEELKRLQEIQKKRRVYFDERDALREELEEKDAILKKMAAQLDGREELQEQQVLDERISQIEAEKQAMEEKVSQMEAEMENMEKNFMEKLAEEDRHRDKERAKMLAAHTRQLELLQARERFQEKEANNAKMEVSTLRKTVKRHEEELKRFRPEKEVKKEPMTPRNNVTPPPTSSRVHEENNKKRTALIDDRLAPPAKLAYRRANENQSCSSSNGRP